MVGPGRNKTSGAGILQRWSHIPLRQALQASRSFVQHSAWPGRQLKKNRAGLPSLGQALKLPTVFHFHWIFVFYFTYGIQNIEQTVPMWHLFPEMWCAPKKNPFHLKFPPEENFPQGLQLAGCEWMEISHLQEQGGNGEGMEQETRVFFAICWDCYGFIFSKEPQQLLVAVKLFIVKAH